MNAFTAKIEELLADNNGEPLDVPSIATALGSGTTRVKHTLAALEARGRVRKVGASGRWTTARRTREATS